MTRVIPALTKPPELSEDLLGHREAFPAEAGVKTLGQGRRG